MRIVTALFLAFMVAGCGGGGGGPADIASLVEQFPDEGRQHVADDVDPVYNTDPPTSGPHYSTPAPGGFYAQAIKPGYLVHSLEHGGIVIYYDPVRVSPTNRDRLRALAEQYPGAFDQVVAVPRSDAEFPTIATAWTRRLRLRGYDHDALLRFVELYRGQGPE